MSELPIISVVTVVYNAAESILKTINSVKEQSYSNIEHIVVDGGSQDGTLASLNECGDDISKLISEKDNGIYDAMNKGALLATGDYITYLNAGDVYYSNDVIERVFCTSGITDHDVIYGGNYYLKNGETILQEPRPLSQFYKGMPFNHQSVFVRASLIRKYPFQNKVYRIQCEYDSLLNLYLKGYSFYQSEIIIAIYESGGFSDVNYIERTLERWIIVKRSEITGDGIDAYYCGLISKAITNKFPLMSYIRRIAGKGC